MVICLFVRYQISLSTLTLLPNRPKHCFALANGDRFPCYMCPPQRTSGVLDAHSLLLADPSSSSTWVFRPSQFERRASISACSTANFVPSLGVKRRSRLELNSPSTTLPSSVSSLYEFTRRSRILNGEDHLGRSFFSVLKV